MKFLERFWLGCGHCHDGHGCPVAEHTDPESGELRLPVEGAALVGMVTAVFVLPLAAAICGAFMAGRWAGASETSLGLWQVGGAVAGFFAGVGLAKLFLVLIRPRKSAERGAE